MAAQPDWSGATLRDDDITPDREQGLELLPADMVELAEDLGEQQANDFREWALRTKRAKWDQGAQRYVKTGGRR